MDQSALRRTAAGLATAGLLAAAGIGAAPAYAVDPVFTLGGPAEVALRPHPGSGEPHSTTVDFTVNNPSEDVENGDFDGEHTVTFDLSGLAGVADVRFGETGSSDCRITGTKGVCTDCGVWVGLSSVAELEVSAAKGGEIGATGDIEVTGSAEGATFTTASTRIVIGGPDLVMEPLNLEQEVAPGDAQPARITFANAGTTAAEGVLLTLIYSRGIEIPERYSNCEYTKGVDGSFETAYAKAICAFEGTFEPGEVYELSRPLTVKAAEHAYIEDFIHRVNEDSPAERAAQRTGAAFDKGAGVELSLNRKTVKARATDLDPWNNQQEQPIRARNTADFAAYGGSVPKAAEGETGTTVGFRNNGPAWVGYLRSGENIGTVDVTIPQGAVVTEKPANCDGVTSAGEEREKQLGAPRYLCAVPSIVLEDENFALPFAMKIEKVVESATGTVTVRNWYESRPALAFDPVKGNNTAQLVLNGKDSGSSASGGTSGGTSGGSTAGGSTGGDGAPSTGGASGESAVGDTTVDGDLASTGSSAGCGRFRASPEPAALG
ncbi:peptidase [Streptomyces sp. HNM0645]|nr:peptidase [Streptomyces sp. HNM0645]